jgi:hypothetical protein
VAGRVARRRSATGCRIERGSDDEGAVRALEHQVDALNIDTLEGTMRASPGDWIIRGVAGELYPCKPGIFAQTYEAVDG